MRISLQKIRLYAYHGVMSQERVVGAEYEISVSVEIAATAAACEHDRLDGTVNYATLYEIVKSEMHVPANLLEHVAWRIGRRIRSTFPEVDSVDIALTKVNPPIGAACAGATVELTL